MKSWLTPKRLVIAFATALTILVGVAWVSYRSITELVEANAAVAETQRVLETLGEVLSEVTAVETGVRGYVITGEELYLEPYQAARPLVSRTLDELRDLTRNSPEQQRRLDTLASLVAARIDVAQGIVELRRQRGATAAARAVDTDQGQRLMEQVRRQVAAMKSAESALLVARHSRARATTRKALLALVVGNLLGFALLLSVFYLLTREIAGRKQTQQELDRFFTLSLDMLCIAGFDGRFKRLNPAWEKTLGWSVADLLAKPYLDFVHPEDRKRTTTEAQKIADGADTISFENRYRCKDGSYKWLLWKSTPLPEEELIYAAARDITERKRAEEALAESERKYRDLFDNSGDLIQSVDAEGRFRYVNPQWLKTLGYTEEEVQQLRFVDILRPDQISHCQDTFSALQRGESFPRFETVFMSKAGHEIFVEGSASPSFSKGQFAGTRGFFRDITERKRYEEEIKRKNQELEVRRQEAERATQLKSQFLASMSHELRTPLNSIIGFSDLVAQETAGPLTEKQKRFVGHVVNGGHHLLQLINDILDLSKIEAGQLLLHPEPVPVAEALPEVLSTIMPLAMKKKIELRSELSRELVVRADRVRFKQILYNLLSNAVKFTPEGGKVWVEGAPEGKLASISVHDTGIGISPEDQEVIFEEFRQVGDTTQGVKEGTGLGLAITKRLVEQQGGQIRLESQPGRGSCFTFTLPLSLPVSPAERPAATPPGVHVRREKPLVLVVDDEPAARELLVSYLEPEGYELVTAASGSEGLAKAAELRPSAITLNMLMPGKSGWETLYELKNDPVTAGIPIVIVSVVDQKKMGFALGAAEYLVKPVAKNVLVGAIRKHLPPRLDGPTTILVVDDEVDTLHLLSEVLDSAGYNALVAKSGAEALQILVRTPVDAILLDLMMPEMDGFEVLRRLKENPAYRAIPVFVLTAKDLTDAEIEQLTRETRAFFRKGFPWKQELLAQVRKALGQPRGTE